MTIHAQCLSALVPPQSVPGCVADFVGQLNCEPACPDINWMMPQAEVNCNPDGTRNVTVGATVTNPSLPLIVAQLEWVEGNNQIIAGPTPSNNGTVILGPVAFPFPSGQQKLHVTVFQPPGCGGSDLPFTVDPCGPVGACCFQTAAGASACEEITQAECQARGGVYKGDGTTCATVDCGGKTNGNGPGGPNACGDGLIWAAAMALALGILLLAIHCLFPVPQLQVILFVGGIVLIILSALLLLIWKLISLFTKCKLDICQAAIIFLGVLAATALIMGAVQFLVPNCPAAPFPCAAPCFWNPAWAIFAGFNAIWVAISFGCKLKGK